MQHKLAELRRAYYIWSFRMQQKMKIIGVKLQRWSDNVTEWWQTVTSTWPSVNHVQRQLIDFTHAAKITLMSM